MHFSRMSVRRQELSRVAHPRGLSDDCSASSLGGILSLSALQTLSMQRSLDVVKRPVEACDEDVR